MISNKYSFLTRLGQGAYGSVVKAKNLENGQIVAAKQIPFKEDPNSQLRVFREVQCLRHCNHENIVKMFEVVFPSVDDDDSPNVSIILEFVESNLKLIIADKRRPLCEFIPRFYFTQILYGISYLHQICGIMHRDLKPENILVTAKNRVRIADFGLACIHFPDDTEREYEHQVATRWYRAPELLYGATKYTPMVDMWALGCILAEFFNGIPMFAGSTDIEQLVKIFNVLGTPTEQSWPDWEQLPDAGKVLFDLVKPKEDWRILVPLASTKCVLLIRSLLQLDSAKRMTALKCLGMDFFAAYPRYDSIPYKPPALEQHFHQGPVDIVFRIIEEDGHNNS